MQVKWKEHFVIEAKVLFFSEFLAFSRNEVSFLSAVRVFLAMLKKHFKWFVFIQSHVTIIISQNNSNKNI